MVKVSGKAWKKRKAGRAGAQAENTTVGGTLGIRAKPEHGDELVILGFVRNSGGFSMMRKDMGRSRRYTLETESTDLGD